MESVVARNDTQSIQRRRWPLFLVGVQLFLLGPCIYAIQFRAKQLGMPWYVLGLASIGVLLMMVSVWQRRGVLRSAAGILFVLLCGFEWYLVLVVTKTPSYTGPAQPGHKAPGFATSLADGTAFSNRDLETGMRTVLLFFRGRW